jgi:hypothetical protein
MAERSEFELPVPICEQLDDGVKEQPLPRAHLCLFSGGGPAQHARVYPTRNKLTVVQIQPDKKQPCWTEFVRPWIRLCFGSLRSASFAQVERRCSATSRIRPKLPVQIRGATAPKPMTVTCWRASFPDALSDARPRRGSFSIAKTRFRESRTQSRRSIDVSFGRPGRWRRKIAN